MRAVLLGPRLGAEGRAVLKRLKREIAKRGTLRVGVDGGAVFWRKHRLGTPDLVVGDWDSLRGPPKFPEATRVMTLSRDKHETDLLAALNAVLARGVREIFCAGFSGGRADHALGVLYDLATASQRARVCLLGEDWEAHFLSASVRRPAARASSWSARARPGTLVSVFALGGSASGVTLQGFQFPLSHAHLKPSSRGLSNRVRQPRVRASLKGGKLVIFVFRD